MLSKSSDNRNRGLRGRKNHVPRFLCAVLAACLFMMAVFALAACSLSDSDDESPHADNGKLRIYYEEPYEVVPKDSFYHEKGFGMFLEAYSSLFSSSEVSGLDSTFLVSGEEEDHNFRSLSMFSEVDAGGVSRQDVKSVIDNFTLPRPEMTDPYLGPVEGEDRAQEVALAENMLRNVEIIH